VRNGFAYIGNGNYLDNTVYNSAPASMPTNTQAIITVKQSLYSGTTHTVNGGSDAYGPGPKGADPRWYPGPSTSNLQIGGIGGESGGGETAGTISELLIYNNSLNGQQITSVNSYLAKKWNISIPTNYYNNTILSNATPLPTPAVTPPPITQPSVNLGYLPVPVAEQGNAGTSTLYYDGTNWSLN
jgi:hypothetical protein